MEIFIAAVVAMAVIGILLGVIIGVAAKIFKVEVDPRIDLVTELLPGVNCGGCGKAGCADLAKSIVSGEEAPSKCPVASQEQISSIAKALGIEVGDSVKKVAVVFCGGDHNQEKVQTLYNGVSDCVSASLIAGGPKAVLTAVSEWEAAPAPVRSTPSKWLTDWRWFILSSASAAGHAFQPAPAI